MTTAPFELHPQLLADTHHVGDLDLSRLLLMDDARYAWLILVPRRAGMRDWIDLPAAEQHRLLDEVAQQRLLGPLSDPPLGYDLVGQHLDGTLSLDEMRVALAQQTAQYARRQRTWFRREEAVSWYPTPEAVPIQELVASVMRRAA